MLYGDPQVIVVRGMPQRHAEIKELAGDSRFETLLNPGPGRYPLRAMHSVPTQGGMSHIVGCLSSEPGGLGYGHIVDAGIEFGVAAGQRCALGVELTTVEAGDGRLALVLREVDHPPARSGRL